MERRLGFVEDSQYDVREGWDPNDLLHPAQAFELPSHVVNDPDLTLNEKRAILASWASDACAPEAAPHLRCAPGGKQSVLFDDLMEALRTLDKQANVRLLDDANFSLYQSGKQHRYFGGLAKNSPIRIAAPHTGHWHVVVDLGGYAGTVSASARVLQGA